MIRSRQGGWILSACGRPLVPCFGDMYLRRCICASLEGGEPIVGASGY